MYIRKYGGKIMNKKVKVTSLAAAALTSMVLANANLNHEVKADVVPEGTSTKAPSAQDNAQANVDSAQKEVDNAQADVNKAKSNLDSAQDGAQKADSAYDAQNAKTQAAQKTESDKKTALDDAQAAKKQAEQLAADANDPAKVKQANDDVTQKQGALKDAQDAQKAADQKVSDQNSKIANDQKAIDDATKVRDQKQSDKNAADAQVKTAEDALKGTGVDEAKQALDKANSDLTRAQSELKQANEKIDELTEAQKTAQSDLNTATADKASHEGAKKTAESEYKAALQKAQDAKTEVEKQQNLIETLQNQLKSLQDSSQNKITIPDMDKYEKAYRDYQGKTHELTQADKDYMDAARVKNKYVASDVDKNEDVDINNISDEQVRDISSFTVNLLNQIRRQFGWEDDVVSDGAIQFARDVANGYLEHHFNEGGHDIDAVNDAAKKNGLSYKDAKQAGIQGYEDMTSISISTPHLSMADLKGKVYDAINSMIFSDGHGYDDWGGPRYELGHARGLIGADEESEDIVPDGVFAKKKVRAELKSGLDEAIEEVKQHPGISRGHADINLQGYNYDYTVRRDWNSDTVTIHLTKDGVEISPEEAFRELDNEINAPAPKQYVAVVPTNDPTTGMPFRIHFVNVSQFRIADHKLFGTNEVPSYAAQIEEHKKDILDHQQKLAGLQNNMPNLNKDAAKKKDQLDKVEQAIQRDAAKIIAAEGELERIGKELDNANSDQATKDKQVQDYTKTQKQAQKKYDDLTADHKTKVENLAKAQKAQEDAKSALDDAQSKLDDAQKTQDKDKDDLKGLQQDAKDKKDVADKAQDDLDAAQKHVDDLKKAPQALKDATDAETKAQSEYDAAKKAADDAAAQLKKLEGDKSTADGQYATAQAAYNDALARLKAAQDKLAEAKAALNRIQNPGTTISIPGQSTSTSEKNNSNTSTSEDNSAKKTTTKKARRVSDRVRLTHNAFVYTKSGKVIRKGLYYKIIRRGRTIKTLKNAKVVTIKGKKFYQIGKNQYIKVANTKIVPYAISRKAIIKGRRVRAYNRSGKFNMHYVKGGRVYKFNERAVINGKTYYKIAWTNNWIPASKLSFR